MMRYLLPLLISFTSIASLQASTLEQVRQRGLLHCGVSTGLPGFAEKNTQGQWTGFDVDMCRAVAAAVLEDASKVKYIPLTTPQRSGHAGAQYHLDPEQGSGCRRELCRNKLL